MFYPLDKTVPSVSVNVTNTQWGHCEKMTTIFKFVNEAIKDVPQITWVVLADDDTILR